MSGAFASSGMSLALHTLFYWDPTAELEVET